MSKIKNDHHESTSMKDLEQIPEYNACKRMIEESGLRVFFEKFQGFDNEVTLQFAKGFNGKKHELGIS